MANNPARQQPDRWTTYFHTADINATASAVTPAGGSIGIEPMEVPATGFMSMATDPSGAVFGLWQPLEHRGFEVIGEVTGSTPGVEDAAPRTLFVSAERAQR